MFYNNHGPPHFHVEYAGQEAKVQIYTLAVSDGRLPRRIQRLVGQWATLHRSQLMENWERAREARELTRIEGL